MENVINLFKNNGIYAKTVNGIYEIPTENLRLYAEPITYYSSTLYKYFDYDKNILIPKEGKKAGIKTAIIPKLTAKQFEEGMNISNMFKQNIKYEDLKICFYDIEIDDTGDFITPSYNSKYPKKILSIAVIDQDGNSDVFIGNETTILNQFLNFIDDYHILIGWNNSNFDDIIIHSKIRNMKLRNCFYSILKIDMLNLYNRAVFGADSLKLDNVAEKELGTRKIEIENFNGKTMGNGLIYELLKAYTFNNNKFDKKQYIKQCIEQFEQNKPVKPNIVSYNLKDVWLLYKLEQKMKIIPLLVEIANLKNISLSMVVNNSSIWNIILSRELYKNNIEYFNPIDPSYKYPIVKLNEDKKIPLPINIDFMKKDITLSGGYTYSFHKGLFKNVYVFDFASLYPSNMICWNISPETKIEPEEAKKYNIPYCIIPPDYQLPKTKLTNEQLINSLIEAGYVDLNNNMELIKSNAVAVNLDFCIKYLLKKGIIKETKKQARHKKIKCVKDLLNGYKVFSYKGKYYEKIDKTAYNKLFKVSKNPFFIIDKEIYFANEDLCKNILEIKNTYLWLKKPLYSFDFIKENEIVLNQNDVIFYIENGKPSYYLFKDVYHPPKYFRTDIEGILPKEIKDLLIKRKELKKKMFSSKTEQEKEYYNTKQLAVKLLANAAYGVFGYNNFPKRNLYVASAISQAGRTMIKYIIKRCEEKGIKIIAGDTDSMFIYTNEDIKKLEQMFNDIIEDFVINKCKCRENIHKFEYEKQFKKLWYVKKKNYITYEVEYDYDGNQVGDAKIKIKGLTFNKSNTSKLKNKILNVVVKKVLIDDDIDGAKEYFIKQCKNITDLKFNLEDIAIKYKITNKNKNGHHIIVAKRLEKKLKIDINEVYLIKMKDGIYKDIREEINKNDIDIDWVLNDIKKEYENLFSVL